MSCLYTDIGAIIIQNSEIRSRNDSEESGRPLYQGTSLSEDSI